MHMRFSFISCSPCSDFSFASIEQRQVGGSVQDPMIWEHQVATYYLSTEYTTHSPAGPLASVLGCDKPDFQIEFGPAQVSRLRRRCSIKMTEPRALSVIKRHGQSEPPGCWGKLTVFHGLQSSYARHDWLQGGNPGSDFYMTKRHS